MPSPTQTLVLLALDRIVEDDDAPSAVEVAAAVNTLASVAAPELLAQIASRPCTVTAAVGALSVLWRRELIERLSADVLGRSRWAITAAGRDVLRDGDTTGATDA